MENTRIVFMSVRPSKSILCGMTRASDHTVPVTPHSPPPSNQPPTCFTTYFSARTPACCHNATWRCLTLDTKKKSNNSTAPVLYKNKAFGVQCSLTEPAVLPNLLRQRLLPPVEDKSKGKNAYLQPAAPFFPIRKTEEKAPAYKAVPLFPIRKIEEKNKKSAYPKK